MNKVGLCWWSKFYDSVFSHPERPPQEIIDDNKKLDEWIKKQAIKSDYERRKLRSSSSGVHKSVFDHDEVILFDNHDDF